MQKDKTKSFREDWLNRGLAKPHLNPLNSSLSKRMVSATLPSFPVDIS
jgi:hypothetical protein